MSLLQSKILIERKPSDDCNIVAAKSGATELEGKIKRLVDAIASIGISDALKARLTAAEAEQKRLQSELEQVATQSVQGQKKEIGLRIKRILLNLRNTLDKDTQQARKSLAICLETSR